MAEALKVNWFGEDICLADVDTALAQLRTEASADRPSMRTSVMTHIAWVPPRWVERARAALEGMAELHPSRTILLFPEPHADDNRIDARAEVERWEVPDTDRGLVTEVVELTLRGARAKAPASIVEPLLISDLPVFLRWRGEPSWGSPELEQLVGVTDRLIVDSIEWDDVPGPYPRLAELFPRCAASDIAWARTSRWRSHLSTLWPAIADVRTVRVRGTIAQGWLLCGWLRSRLGRDDIALEHDRADQLEAVALDGEAVPLPPGDPPSQSDLLSEELERFTPDPVYEAAVLATFD
ncbi:MAG TPA: glucose-6-phosphate dehydrogenase assembly protein OpcA [Gaiellaceae bacterium]|nr:glucose-6-phosphate dehydrogenase assembly protein OpcA [Gaiellaceae bacterium]